MVLEKDQNVFLASSPSAGQFDAIVEHVVVDFGVVVDRVVVTKMVVDMVQARWQQPDGKTREHMVVLYFPLLPLQHWSDLIASSGGYDMISSPHLKHWQCMSTTLSLPRSQFVPQQKQPQRKLGSWIVPFSPYIRHGKSP